MNRNRFISQAMEMRQIAVGAASTFVDNEEAEDVAQETLLRMWENIERLDDDETRLKSFVSVTARNLAQDRLRHKRRHPILQLLNWHESPHNVTPLSILEASETDVVFAQAMKRLPYNWHMNIDMYIYKLGHRLSKSCAKAFTQ